MIPATIITAISATIIKLERVFLFIVSSIAVVYMEKQT